MKKKLSIAISLLIFLPLSAFAYEYYGNIVGCGITTIPQFIKALLGIVVKIGIPVASIFIIWSGFMFLTAQGDTSKLAAAKKSLVWACIGFGVLIGAWLFALTAETVITSFSGGTPQNVTNTSC